MLSSEATIDNTQEFVNTFSNSISKINELCLSHAE